MAELEKSSEQRQEARVEKTVGNLTTSVTVEKIKNGFLVNKSIYGYKPEDTEKKDYVSVNEKYFSETNPIEDGEIKSDAEEPKGDLIKGINSLLNSLSKSEGMLRV